MVSTASTEATTITSLFAAKADKALRRFTVISLLCAAAL